MISLSLRFNEPRNKDTNSNLWLPILCSCRLASIGMWMGLGDRAWWMEYWTAWKTIEEFETWES